MEEIGVKRLSPLPWIDYIINYQLKLEGEAIYRYLEIKEFVNYVESK
jgi:hypothetical protein